MPAFVSVPRLHRFPAQRTLQRTLGSILDGLLDLVVASRLLEHAGQVDNGDVGGRDTHGHASELAVQAGDDLANSLRSTGAGRNDVLRSCTTTAPILAGGAVDSLLGSSFESC
jgi:hypothetical protein